VARCGYDAAHHHPDADVRKQNQAFYEFMVPLVKGYSTEMSLEVTSLGVQVHGGMGFIEETGAAQYLPRRQDPDHLRRHHRDPGQRPGRPQDRARRRPDGQGHRAQIEATEPN
jgi:alkylation response protein AidB-like acyl-CoA dehydrogenase